jgi:hypothetical protein
MDERDRLSLWVKFPVDGWGTIEDLDFRHRLEDDLTELLEHHHLGLWEGSGQGGGVQDVSYSVPTSSLEAAWDVVRAKLAELGVLQRATVEVYFHDEDGPPWQLWPYRNLPKR